MTRAVMDLDWSEMVFDLKRAGMAQHEICRALGGRITEGMIRQYMVGAQPQHWRGEMLIALWSERTGKDRSQAPTRPPHIAHTSRSRNRRARFAPILATGALDQICQQYNISTVVMLAFLAKQARPHRLRRSPENLHLPGFESGPETDE